MNRIFIHKNFEESIKELDRLGSAYKTVSSKLKTLIYDIKHNSKENGIVKINLPVTNNGENRIKHCVKYDLGYKNCRLVTVQNDNVLILLYAGTHENVDKWLNKNAGKVFKIDENGIIIDITERSSEKEREDYISAIDQDDYVNRNTFQGLLIDRLRDRYQDIFDEFDTKIYREISKFDCNTTEDEITSICEKVEDSKKRNLLFDILIALLHDNEEEAIRRIADYRVKYRDIETLSPEEKMNIKPGDTLFDIHDFDAEDLNRLINNASFYQWMLFMHPDQKDIAEKDFSGSVKLLGVSGSGKTAIIIKRAKYLHTKYPDQKILILTLNDSLASLIRNLASIEYSEGTLKYIDIRSLWELYKDIINTYFENADELLKKKYVRKTYLLNESLTEIWDEFYTCRNNNDDAKILLPVIMSLNSQNVDPNEYIHQEFDYIRSVYAEKKYRNKYLNLVREGRVINFNENYRKMILEGLECWEKKMKDIGIIDYAAFSSEIYKIIDKIKTKYRCVLIDEIQDFGTVELSIIRKLVEKNDNDIFMAGDIAQKVFIKHQNFDEANIDIVNTIKIKKNYRNSKDILHFAYTVLKNSQYGKDLEKLEIIDPDYSNFSSQPPLLLRANSLVDEINSAIQYFKESYSNNKGKKVCIAIAGLNLDEVTIISNDTKIPILNSELTTFNEQLYISDLEQTKGFEFDCMIILNVENYVIPSSNMPSDEWYRDLTKLYVSMTRAKKELIISYHNEPSLFLKGLNENDYTKGDWSSFIDKQNIYISQVKRIQFSKNRDSFDLSKMSGRDFVLTPLAIGFPVPVQEGLLEYVKSTINKKKGWVSMEDIIKEKSNDFGMKIFGSKRWENLINELKNRNYFNINSNR
ncbi:MAG: UvrD-helicase domain-containing protein [Spirochaetota bacterium]